MTIDEGIKNLEYGTKQLEMEIESGLWIKGSESELCCKEGIALNKKCIEWLTELKHLRDEVHKMKPDLDDKNRALKEAKRLLKLAVDDANSEAESLCAFCKHNHVVDGCPYIESYSECEYIWRYTDEALKLIKEEK
ncbi:hypothetical protein [Ruminococcus flavefaciens]|uniref:hypothetical protein n=1 Tax=Ruminococcus flavefaciens TaxID=1265 RepID=UPI0026F0AA0B|nr:hypothetical protein [Ruminococcus flavefaciens]